MAVEGGAGHLGSFGDCLDGDGFDATAAEQRGRGVEQAVARPGPAGVDIVVIRGKRYLLAAHTHSPRCIPDSRPIVRAPARSAYRTNSSAAKLCVPKVSLMADHLPHQDVASGRTDAARPELLPAHTPTCMGCGPQNPHGLQLVAYRSGDTVYADVTFDERHIGAPGLAHGGAIAAACDDVLGFALWIAGCARCDTQPDRRVSPAGRAASIPPHHRAHRLPGRPRAGHRRDWH